MELILCRVVLFANSQYRSTHFFRTTFHDIRPLRNTNILGIWKFFSCFCRNSGFKHGSVIVDNIPCLFHIVFEYSPGIHGQGKMLVLPNRLLY